MHNPLTVHVIDGFTACNWGDATTQIHGSLIHGSALGYYGRWDTHVRWLWAIAEAIRAYQNATGRERPDMLVLAPVQAADLRHFLRSLPGTWPDQSAVLLADDLRAHLAAGMKVDIVAARKQDLRALIGKGDAMILQGMIGRTTHGVASLALMAG